MKKQDIYNAMIKNTVPYKGTIYLACCIGVEYDYDLVSHFIKYYKELGIDEFLIVLNTNIPHSERLIEVQNILRKYGIEEKYIWRGEHSYIRQTQTLMELIKKSTEENCWILSIDMDEFQEYFCDLRRFISYMEENDYEYAAGTYVDRVSVSGDILAIDNDTDLFEAFPVKTTLTRDIMYSHRDFVQKIAIHRSYIKLSYAQHSCMEEEKIYKCCPNIIDIHHFKWRGDLIKNTIDRIEMYKNNHLSYKHLENCLNYYNE